jgi:NAD(P)H-flavin reductase
MNSPVITVEKITGDTVVLRVDPWFVPATRELKVGDSLRLDMLDAPTQRNVSLARTREEYKPDAAW